MPLCSKVKAPANEESNVSNTRKSVSSGYPNTEKWWKKRGAADFFFNRLRGVWIRDETLFEFLIWPFKPFIILGDIQSKSSQNFMLI